MIGSFWGWDLKNRLSLLRKPLMGFAIIWIFMLHSGKTGNSVWDAIRFYGWSGVDIFFFLSAIGLCYSLSKDNSTLAFYKRRAKRILPTWFFVLLAVHLVGLICNHYLPKLPFYIPDTLLKCFTWYTGVGFWISDFTTGKGWFYEWYVPSLLAYYIVTPYLNKKRSLSLSLLIVLFLIIGYLFGKYDILPNIHFFYYRIPIFILGLLFYRLMIDQNCRTFNISIVVSFFIGLVVIFVNSFFSLAIPKEFFPLFLCPPCMIMLTYLIEFKYIKNFFSFFGGISLEFYLIHLYKRPHYLISLFFDNKYVIIGISFVVCTIAAVVLQKIVNKVLQKIF